MYPHLYALQHGTPVTCTPVVYPHVYDLRVPLSCILICTPYSTCTPVVYPHVHALQNVYHFRVSSSVRLTARVPLWCILMCMSYLYHFRVSLTYTHARVRA